MASMVWTQLEASALLREHGLAEAGWMFKWDNARRRGGQCDYNRKTISMSKHLVPLWSEDEVKNTLLHEIAHAMAGHAAGHGPRWRAMARMIGCNAERTHSNETVQGRYKAVCDRCGVEVRRAHRLSPAMKQGRHLHATCRQPVRWVDTATVVR